MKEDKAIDSNEIHDFFHERFIFKVLGGYYVLNKSKIHFVINVSIIGCVLFLDVCLLCMGVYTLAMPEINGKIKAHIFQILCSMTSGFAAPSIRFFYRHNFNAALNCLKRGIDQYGSEVLDEEHVRIKTRRLKQVRLWSLIFGVVCYLTATSNTIQSPLLEIFSSAQNDPQEELINFYLPLPIYVPFNSKTYFGFIAAFLLITIHFFSMYTSLFCFVETYLSSVLQLLAQIEILNHSINNIEKRARLNYRNRRMFSTGPGNSTDLNDTPDYQKDLYMCLRSNIQHHQNILRYFYEVKEFVGAMNTFCLLVFAIIFASSVVPLIKDPLGNFALITTLMAEFVGYFQLFWVGQIVRDASADTINSLYSTPWINCNKNFNVLLNLMYTNAKRPMILRAPSLNTDWTLKTFGDLLSGGYKLVNLLMNML